MTHPLLRRMGNMNSNIPNFRWFACKEGKSALLSLQIRQDIHVIGVVQTGVCKADDLSTPPLMGTDDRKVKRKLAEDDLERNIKRHVARRWTVNGSIRQVDIPRCYYLDPGLQPASALCLTAVKNSQFVLLSGARASGKSTRLLWLEVKLGDMSYKPV
jgi:hypothetical protein